MNPERWRQIESIYSRALESDPAARASFLEVACQGDESLAIASGVPDHPPLTFDIQRLWYIGRNPVCLVDVFINMLTHY